jgi:hypothetical protein
MRRPRSIQGLRATEVKFVGYKYDEMLTFKSKNVFYLGYFSQYKSKMLEGRSKTCQFRCRYSLMFNIFVLSNSVDQSPSWEAYSMLSKWRSSLLLWSSQVHYPVQRIPPSILSRMNSVHTLSSSDPCNVVLPFSLCLHLSGGPFPFRRFNQNVVHISNLPEACYIFSSFSS